MNLYFIIICYLYKLLFVYSLLLLLLLHLITHPTKCYTNSKVRALSEKTNSEQVRLPQTTVYIESIRCPLKFKWWYYYSR